MKLFEIDKKYFSFKPGVVQLLESYNNPSSELRIDFKQVDEEFGNHYYRGTVYELSTGDRYRFFN